MNMSTIKFKRLVTSVTIFVAAFALVFMVPSQIFADSYQDQIEQLQAQIDAFQDEAIKLAREADTLQNKVNQLQLKINTIQKKVDLSEAKVKKLNAEIKEAEAQITEQTGYLSEMLMQMYVESETSPLEILAGSDSIGDYIAQQSYQESIRDQISASVSALKTLKQQLTDKKIEVEKVLASQQAQRDQVKQVQNEQASLLARTRGEEANYQKMIKETKQDIYKLQQEAAQQAGAIVIPGDPNKGGYPAKWADPPLDSVIDSWGMYNRECVSYAAFKVEQNYGDLSRAPFGMPYWGGIGNANQWDENADAAGIPRGTSPREGSVAIANSVYSGDPYGHAAWVESAGSGMVTVSQYNWGSPGAYSEMTVPATFFDTYIYFGS